MIKLSFVKCRQTPLVQQKSRAAEWRALVVARIFRSTMLHCVQS